MPSRSYQRNHELDILAPVYNDTYIMSIGDTASVILLVKIRSLVTTDGAVGGNTEELSAQVTVRLGLSHGKCTS